MLNPPLNVQRHFLDWHRPLLPQAADWLAGGWAGAGPLDLSRVLVVVPTRQSGRRLREALAGKAAAHGQAVFPPRVLTPDALIAHELGPRVASRLQSLLAWTVVFRAIDLDAFRHVFPVDPAVRNFPWALQLAQEFARLQAVLAEAGCAPADVPDRAEANFVEGPRWREIAALSELHAARLAEVDLRDAQAARLAAAARVSETRASFERVVVMAVPDPAPLALARLAALAPAGPVDVIVFAPESEAAAFDEWGRPMPAAWAQRDLALAEFQQRVHVCANPAGQAAQLAALAGCYARPDGLLALALADPAVAPLLVSELTRLNVPAFNPDGRSMRRESLYQLLGSLAALARDPSFAAVETLARCPDFFAWLRARVGGGYSVARWLAGLDELRARHLPADLAAAREFAARFPRCPELGPGLEAMEQLRQLLATGAFVQSTAEALREIYGARELDLARDADAQLREAALAWTAVLRECAETEQQFGALDSADAWDLALRVFGELRWVEEKPPGALELQGWLELLWEDAPHLAVAGLNDGHVPESVLEDAFLPQSLRQRLGLTTEVTRFARDAYILQAIAACRGAGVVAAGKNVPAPQPSPAGRLDLLFGKTSSAGDPLRPSRLLLRCADADLPERIAFLFRTPELADAQSVWTRSWKLTPRMTGPPARVAVTALRRYLQCPFRFYLRNVLKMETVDPLKAELDAFDFGTLCHAALEQIGLNPALRESTDPDILGAELVRHLDAAVRDRYGRDLSLPLLVQVESARQRLTKLAQLQAAERAAGWVIAQVERPFEITVSGLLVRGKIDRIDRHAETGAVRVLDYKTSDTPVTPEGAHLRARRAGESGPEWARCEVGGKSRVWADLQLPLYLRALAAEFPGRLACGYFVLPKAAGETALTLWHGYTPELHEAAMRCADGACAAICAGEFWPPNESMRAERDECAALFHHGCAESVTWGERPALP